MDHRDLSEWTLLPQSPADVRGYFNYQPFWDALVAEARDGWRIAEVGCLVGRSTAHLAETIGRSRPPKRIHVFAVDRCTGSTSDVAGQAIALALGGSYAGVLSRNLRHLGLADTVTPIVQDSVIAASLFPDNYFDCVFLDGDHAREAVAADIDAWHDKVRPNGWLAGHDWRSDDFPGVTEAVIEAFGGRDHAHPSCPSVWAVRV